MKPELRNATGIDSVKSPPTIRDMDLPFDSRASAGVFIEYNQSIQPDQIYIDQFDGTELKGPGEDDLRRYGFNSEYIPAEFSLSSFIKDASRNRALRLAGVVILALTGASFFPDNHQSAASNIKPLDSDPDYEPLFPHGEMVIHAHDDQSHSFGPSPDLPQLNPAEFTTLSGGGFTATRIHGDGALTDLSYIIVGQDYPDDQKLLDSGLLYTQHLLSIEPFKSIQDKISISVLHTQNTPKLVSSISSVFDVLGDNQKVQKLIDDVHLALGPYQELRLLVNDTDSYAAAAYADPSISTLYSYAGFTEAKLRGPFNIKDTIAHEEGHATGGAGEGYYSTENHAPNIYNNCLTADQIPIRWKGIPGAPGAIYEGCANAKTGAFRDAEVDFMSNYQSVENPTYGPVTLWQLNHRLDGAPAIYYPLTLLAPTDGITVNGLGADLRFNPSEMTKQFQVQVIPYNSDGPGVNLIIGDPKLVKAAEFKIVPPKLGVGPYIMLSDMTYTWRVRKTSAAKPVGENDPVWGDWTERKFRTPATSSSTLSLPGDGFSAASTPDTPFVWSDSDTTHFYYEIQASGDPGFNTNPDTATSFVWWNLVHGGMSNPLNSWRAPRLELNTAYYWRVRPRVQGDGTPLDWGPVWSFTTGSNPNAFVTSHEVPSPAGSQ